MIFGNDVVEVYRYTPENRDYAKPEIVATFTPHKNSAVHSFAVTESYAVFFFPAMTYNANPMCLFENKFHILECMVYLEDEATDVFIVNFKTGEVQEIQVTYAIYAIQIIVLVILKKYLNCHVAL